MLLDVLNLTEFIVINIDAHSQGITHYFVFVTTVPITVCAFTAYMTHHIGKLLSNNRQNT